jgi:hypothetical protein
MYKKIFKDKLVAVQAQSLLYLIKSKKLKESTSFFGIQKSTKYTKVKLNVYNDPPRYDDKHLITSEKKNVCVCVQG